MSPRLSDLLLSSQSDERLVALARAGHERAFVAIVERYRPELQALARQLCADGRGEDVVQQAFLSAFAALRSGAEVRHLRGWLYRITRNAAYGSRSPVAVPLDAATASPETVEDVVQQRALALSALNELAQLPARQRQAMVGTVRGMGRSEMANTMGLSEGAVRQLVHRARSTLRTAVTAVTPWPLARWFAAIGQSSPGSAELAAGAGAVSSGGIVLKIGALVASGTLATGVAAVDLHGVGSHRSGARHASPAHMQVSVHRAPVGAAPAVGPSIALAAASSRQFVSAPVGAGSPGTGNTGSGAGTVSLRAGRHERGDGHSGTREDGSRGHHDGSPGNDGGTRSFDGGHRGSGGGDSSGGSDQIVGGDRSSSGSGSGQRGDGGGGDRGGSDHLDGGGTRSSQPSVSIADASFQRDGGDHSGSRDGSGSSLGSSSGSGSSGGSSSGSDSSGGSSSGSGSSSAGSSSSSGGGPGPDAVSGSGSGSGSGSAAGSDN